MLLILLILSLPRMYLSFWKVDLVYWTLLWDSALVSHSMWESRALQVWPVQGILLSKLVLRSLITKASVRQLSYRQMRARSCCVIFGTWARSNNLHKLWPLKARPQTRCRWVLPLGAMQFPRTRWKLLLTWVYRILGIGQPESLLCSMIRNGYIKFGHRYKICTGRGNLIKPEKEMIACYFLEGII